MRKLYLVLFLSPASVVGQSYDHLEPEGSIFGTQVSLDYYSNVAKVLGDVLPYQSPKVTVMIPIRERVIGIDDSENPCSVVVGSVEQSLWSYEVRANNPDLDELPNSYPEDPMDVAVNVSREPISQELCTRIRAAWISMLLGTRYPAPEEARIGVDGVTYHFSAWHPGQLLAGKIWSPDRGTTTGKLVMLSRVMESYAGSGSAEDLADIESTLEDLESDLQ